MRHENYRGYDAIAGKPGSHSIEYTEKPPLAEHIGALDVVDLPKGVPVAWLPRLRDVKNLCERRGWRFAMSPYEHQVAKVMGDNFTVVLWNSRVKGSKERFIKLAHEGVMDREESKAVMAELQPLVA